MIQLPNVTKSGFVQRYFFNDAREERKRGFPDGFEACFWYGKAEDPGIEAGLRERSETAEAMADTASSAV